jgi:hypothetical protein
LLLGAALATEQGTALARSIAPRFPGVVLERAGHELAGHAWRAVAVGLALLAPIALAVLGRLSSARMMLALRVVIAGDLALAALPLMSWAPSEIYRQPSPVLQDLRALSSGDAEGFRFYRPLYLPLPRGGAPGVVEWLSLLPNVGMDIGLEHLNAYEVYYTPREALWWTTVGASPLQLMRVASARYALLPRREVSARTTGLTVLREYDLLDAVLVRVEDAAPRVYLATEALTVPDAAAAARAVLAPGFVAGQSAAVEGGPARTAAGACRLEHRAPESLRVRCQSDRPAYLVVNDGIASGWQATVDGRPAPILPANVVFRAVAIPAGTSVVQMDYRPRGLLPAAMVSLAGLLGCGVLLARGCRKTRR